MKAFHEIRSYPDNYNIWYGQYENMSFYAHWHEEIEIIFIRKGEASIHINNHKYDAKAGDLLICRPSDIHYCDSYDNKNSLEFLVLFPMIISSRAFQKYPCSFISAEELSACGLSELVVHTIDSIKVELRDRKPYYKDIVSSHVRQLWYQLQRAFPSSISHEHKSHFAEFQQLLLFLDNHFAEKLSLEEAAKHAHLSDCYLSKLFSKYTGMNFVTYVNTLRIENALSRLHNQDTKIIDVALDCGFTNIRTFNRVFLDMVGCTPSEYQKQGESDYNLFFQRKSSEHINVENDSSVVITKQ